jgi:tRNA (guanine-N7-)-methyltransferase
VHPVVLAEVARVMKPGAEWRIASDDATYQAWVAEVLAAQAFFTVPAPLASRPEGWRPTRYEAKALAAARQPLYWALRRLGAPEA